MTIQDDVRDASILRARVDELEAYIRKTRWEGGSVRAIARMTELEEAIYAFMLRVANGPAASPSVGEEPMPDYAPPEPQAWPNCGCDDGTDGDEPSDRGFICPHDPRGFSSEARHRSEAVQPSRSSETWKVEGGQLRSSPDGLERIKVFGCYGSGSYGTMWSVSAPNLPAVPHPIGMFEEEIRTKYPHIAAGPLPRSNEVQKPSPRTIVDHLPDENRLPTVWAHLLGRIATEIPNQYKSERFYELVHDMAFEIDRAAKLLSPRTDNLKHEREQRYIDREHALLRAAIKASKALSALSERGDTQAWPDAWWQLDEVVKMYDSDPLPREVA